MRTQLYKKDTKGKIRTLILTTNANNLLMTSGILHGKLTETIRTCTPKNIGKNNETTGSEQALLELASIKAKKLKEGYFLTEEEASDSSIILPMLAKQFKDHKHKINYPCFVQPKLDGMRCIANNKVMLSRKNTPITTLPHIATELTGILPYIDGELYAHGLSFQENMRLIKKHRNDSVTVKYHVYDMISDKPFVDRFNDLFELIATKNNIEIVPTTTVFSEEEIMLKFIEFVEAGYEGIIIRHGNKRYEVNKRSDSLLKYKEFIDEALPLKDVIASDKNHNIGIPVFETAAGKKFKAGVKMTTAEKTDLLTNKNKYINKIAELRFFEYTNDDIPRFPIMIGFRLDKV